jgi:hypothetical protein
VYERFVREIGSWWDSEHTYSGDAKNLSIDANPGGCWCETLPDGGGVAHMTVVYVVPGRIIRFTGGLGPLQELAAVGTMTFAVSAAKERAGATEAVLTYNAAGYRPGGLASWAGGVDFVLTTQMDRLKRFVETGDPKPQPAK